MKRITSFWYLESNHTPAYRKEVLDHLISVSWAMNKMSGSKILVQVGNPERNLRDMEGSVHIFNLRDSESRHEELLKYILSKNRDYIPVCVSCERKEDYARIEEILQESQGEGARLTNGLLGIPRLFNQRRIKIQ